MSHTFFDISSHPAHVLGVTGPRCAAKELLPAGLLEQFKEESAGLDPLGRPIGQPKVQ